MKKTSIKQKLLLLTLSVVFTVILLEIGLRIAGGIVLYLQERHNHVTFNRNEYRILCLGESTTALGGEDSYPSQLEAMLNAQSRHIKFTVINKGIVSTTSDYILAHVDQDLEMYKPQMVIVMMGINDEAYMPDPDKAFWRENVKSYLKDFRVYKLAHLLYEHITHRIKEISVPAKTVDLSRDNGGDDQRVEGFLKVVISGAIERFHEHMSALARYRQDQQIAQARQEEQFARQSAIAASSAAIELARRYRLQGLFQEAQSILEKLTVFNVNNQDVYREWGELYLAQEKSAQAQKAFQAALELDPKNSDDLLGLARAYYKGHNDDAFLVYAGYLQTKPQDYWGYIELAQWLRKNKHYDAARMYLNRAIEIGPDFDQGYVDSGQIFDDQGQYKEEEAFWLKEISLHTDSSHPDISRFYEALGRFYQKRGREDLAEGYFRKAARRRMAEYLPATLANYGHLLEKILSRNIKTVVMQYPLRDIGPLEDYLGHRDGVVFVENRQNFKQALAMGGFRHYFKDNFAYDFGHCTRAGNELIARNLTEEVTSVIASRSLLRYK